MKRLSSIACAIAGWLFSSPAYAAPAGFDDAVKTYNARQYSAALGKFLQVARANPNDVLTRYYMGLCYQQTHQFSMAKQQYEWVSAMSKDPGIKNSCRQALDQLGRYQSQRVGSSSVPAYSGGPADFGGLPSSPPVRISGRLKVIEFYTDW